jgi:hypothetical protein
MDQAAIYIAQATTRYPPLSPIEEKKLIRRIDWILVPMLLLTATLGAVDKVAISTAAIYGLRDDLHLTGNQYSWAGSILYFGVCLVDVFTIPLQALITLSTVHLWHVALVICLTTHPFGEISS